MVKRPSRALTRARQRRSEQTPGRVPQIGQYHLSDEQHNRQQSQSGYRRDRTFWHCLSGPP
jgi:hypothetical protein